MDISSILYPNNNSSKYFALFVFYKEEKNRLQLQILTLPKLKVILFKKFPLVKDLLENITIFCFVKLVVTGPFLDSDHKITVQERHRLTKRRFQ